MITAILRTLYLKEVMVAGQESSGLDNLSWPVTEIKLDMGEWRAINLNKAMERFIKNN